MVEENYRIISLIPSATEILSVLGLTDQMVGRSHECDYPPEIQNLPVCTSAQLDSQQPSAIIDDQVKELLQAALSLYGIELERLEQLKPTHILTQDQCNVCAVSFADVEQAVAQLTQSNPRILSFQPKVLQDIWTDIEQVGHVFGVESQGVLSHLRSRIAACAEKTQNLSESQRPIVACLEWIDPLMACGSWIPELVQIAGGQVAFGVVGTPSPYIAWDSLIETNPDYLIMMPCGFDLARTRQEMTALVQHSQWQTLKAVQQNQVYITDGNAYFNRPGPRLVDSLEIVAEILHPDLFNYGYEGQGWERFSENIY